MSKTLAKTLFVFKIIATAVEWSAPLRYLHMHCINWHVKRIVYLFCLISIENDVIRCFFLLSNRLIVVHLVNQMINVSKRKKIIHKQHCIVSNANSLRKSMIDLEISTMYCLWLMMPSLFSKSMTNIAVCYDTTIFHSNFSAAYVRSVASHWMQYLLIYSVHDIYKIIEKISKRYFHH